MAKNGHRTQDIIEAVKHSPAYQQLAPEDVRREATRFVQAQVNTPEIKQIMQKAQCRGKIFDREIER